MGLAFLQPRENRKDTLNIFFNPIGIFSGKTGQLQIFHYRQIVKQPPAFRDMRNSQLADYFVGSVFKQVGSGKCHFGTLFDGYHPGYGFQCRAFSGTIGSDNTHDFAFVYLEIHAVQRLDVAIGNSQILD